MATPLGEGSPHWVCAWCRQVYVMVRCTGSTFDPVAAGATALVVYCRSEETLKHASMRTILFI